MKIPSASGTNHIVEEFKEVQEQPEMEEEFQTPFVQIEEGDCEEVKQSIKKMEELYEKQQAIFSGMRTCLFVN